MCNLFHFLLNLYSIYWVLNEMDSFCNIIKPIYLSYLIRYLRLSLYLNPAILNHGNLRQK